MPRYHVAFRISHKEKTLLKTLQDVGWAKKKKKTSCKIVCHRLVLELKAYAMSSVEKFPRIKSMKFSGAIRVQKKIDSFNSVVLITQVKITQISTISSWEWHL